MDYAEGTGAPKSVADVFDDTVEESGGSLPPLCRYQACVIRCGHHPFRHSSQILGGGSQQEFIICPAEATQSQLVQFQNALEVGEQHLDFFPLPA